MISSGYSIEAGADLHEANLRGANLHEANLREANLREANLQYANLRGADLQYANLHEANLREADLQDTDLREANLRRADLQGANLRGADLQGANLHLASLQDADLRGANLLGANLLAANLKDADLREAKLPAFQIVPEVGSFVAYKAFADGVVGEVAVPAHAKRNSSLIGRKCRVSQAVLTRLLNSDKTTVRSWNQRVLYNVGAAMMPDRYNPDIRVECTNGIHLFITKQEAEQWAM